MNVFSTIYSLLFMFTDSYLRSRMKTWIWLNFYYINVFQLFCKAINLLYMYTMCITIQTHIIFDKWLIKWYPVFIYLFYIQETIYINKRTLLLLLILSICWWRGVMHGSVVIVVVLLMPIYLSDCLRFDPGWQHYAVRVSCP